MGCPPSPWTHRSGKVRDRAVGDTKRCRCARAEFGSLFSFLAEKKKLGLACGQFPPRDLCLKGPTEKTSGKVWQVGFSNLHAHIDHPSAYTGRSRGGVQRHN